MGLALQHESLGVIGALGSQIALPATYTINIWVKNVTLPGQEWSNLYLQNSGYKYILDANYGAIGAGTGPARLAVSAANPLLVADTFHLVTCVFDGTTIEYYVNGVSIGSTTPGGAAPTVIDVVNGPGGQNFAAEVKDMRLYSGIATANEILASYNSGTGALTNISSGISAEFYLQSGASDAQGQFNGSNLQNIVFSNDPSAGASGRDVAVFNGSSYFDIDGALFTNVNTKYSLSMWVKSDGWTNGDQPLLTDHDNDNTQPNSSDSMFFWIEGIHPNSNNQGKLMVQHKGPDLFGAGHPRSTVGSAGTVTENAWVHIGVTWNKGNGSNGATKIYFNGQLDSTRINNQEPWDSVASIRVGESKNMGGFVGFDGSMANIMFWSDRELGAADMLNLYNQGITSEASQWDPLNGLAGVKEFANRRNSSGEAEGCFLTEVGGVSRLVVTDDLRDYNQLRTFVISETTGVNTVSVVGDQLFAAGLEDGTIRILKADANLDAGSWVSDISDPSLTSVRKIFKKRNSAGPGLVVVSNDGKVRFIDTLSADGTTNSGLSAKQFDIGSLNGFPTEVFDVEIGGDYIVVLSRNDNGGVPVIHAFNFNTEAPVALNNLPFAPWEINYFESSGNWIISNGESAVSSQNLLDWQ